MFKISNGEIVELAKETMRAIRKYIGLEEVESFKFKYDRVNGMHYCNGFHDFEIVETLPHGTFKLRIKKTSEDYSKYETVAISKDVNFLQKAAYGYRFSSYSDSDKDHL